MREHGSAHDALAALPEIARAAGVKDYRVCPLEIVQKEWRAAALAGAFPVAIGSEDYPDLLAQIPDAPPVFWALGSREILHRPMIAMVGGRNSSSLGTRMARRLAHDLGQAGFVIVSGLARGIDAAAHVASVATGTLAVMAGGVDVVYPAENAALAQEICEGGLRLSEHPLGLRPIGRHFPQRNRLISGLCRATIVVEAAARSGSLITAKYAADQGRDVFAVPGHPFDGRAAGANFLIRDGAALVRDADDVLSALNCAQQEQPRPVATLDASPPPSPATRLQTANTLHNDILSRLSPSPVAEDQLIRDLHSSAAILAPALLNLELDGKIERQAGGLLSLAN
jgi:DNA processing protein